ncbi:hypothetical protein OH76DRAFT_1120783 [Lentinus brumalis]|uniref:Uncharacterized protein n=1 Tax=Lentinus brumalis TaxID=2498619 RepID=A0A371CUQ9_9APHY|nr:hypothetical protein OH76DRAFT_1120783 [Polyporus brumalis]
MKREASKVRTPPIADCMYTVREGPIVMQTAVVTECMHPVVPRVDGSVRANSSRRRSSCSGPRMLDVQRAHTRGGNARPGGNSGCPRCPLSHSHFTGALHALEPM